MSGRPPAIVYVGHHKCASQWMMGVLAAMTSRRGDALIADWRRPPRSRAYREGQVVFLQDYETGILPAGCNVRGVHLVRDPRDVLVSLLHSHRGSHPARDPRTWEILRDRVALRSMDLSSGLTWLMDHSGYFRRVIDAMSNWDYRRSDFLELRFEDFVVGASQDSLLALAGHIGTPLDANGATVILDEYSFERLQAADGTDRTRPGHYRSGGSSTWQDAFDEDLISRFESRFGRQAATIGYGLDG